jgi:hypothetical protein
VTINGGQAWGWVDFVFPSPVAVSAGTVWIGYIGGAQGDLMQMRYESSPSETRYNADPYSNGASNPFGTPTLFSGHYSIYATYSS